MAEYIWADGCRISKKVADPQGVGEALDALQQDQGGRLTPRAVVDAARPVASVLHRCFEWDDLRASELYREIQARLVVRSIRLVQPQSDPDAAPQTIHAFVSLMEGEGDDAQQGYVPVARMLNSPALLQQALTRAALELKSFERRYAEFAVIARVVQAAREELEHVALHDAVTA